MNRKNLTIQLLALSTLFLSCKNNGLENDASGTFEATETVISAEAAGKIMAFDIDEGDLLTAGQTIGYIDSTQLYLTKLQLQQNQKAILSGRPDTKVQLEALQKELDNALSDKQRIENLVKGNVASQKQLDDANTRIAILQSKMAATKSSLTTTTSTINEQSNTVAIQLASVQDQLRKCRIVNPVNGTVLTKYANAFEVTAPGKPLYKIADLTEMYLRAYITADLFGKAKIGDKVKVSIDAAEGTTKEYEGVIEWISNKSEFTPKTIQTKDERANLVYAVKIKVKNDGLIKIGMYGEVNFKTEI